QASAKTTAKNEFTIKSLSSKDSTRQSNNSTPKNQTWSSANGPNQLVLHQIPNTDLAVQRRRHGNCHEISFFNI
ncbi:hypothetical protein ABTD90_18910, partial [Acinetobacter baumannii]